MKSEKIKISELDFFFMSLDEPNADKNYYDLLTKVPRAKRAQGIIGFDAVHRYCGENSTTPYLVTIDADTVIDEDFLSLEIDVPFMGARNLCWSSRNNVNGLTYGNGGIKLWNKVFASTMAHHEEGDNGIDFCWDNDYISIDVIYSQTIINGSPFQAFRSGYREGVKLSLYRGNRIELTSDRCITPYNLRLLATWCTVGMDVLHGKWAILGARQGLVDNVMCNFDLHKLSDFEFLRERFDSVKDVDKELRISEELLSHYTPFNFPILSPDQSKLAKRIYLTKVN